MENSNTTIEYVKKHYEKRGIMIEERTYVKNSVVCRGITIKANGEETNVSPVIYYGDSDTAEDIIRRVNEILQKPQPKVDLLQLKSWKYIQGNVFLALQKRSSEPLLKRKYLGLEVILRVMIELPNGESGSVKVTQNLLDLIGRSEDEVWDAARFNSGREFTVQNFSEIFGFESEDEFPLTMARCKQPRDGAAVLLYTNVFDDYCRRKKYQSCVILPSSTDEVILCSGDLCNNDNDIRDFSDLVKHINGDPSVIEPEMVLSDCIYKYTLNSGFIEILS